MRRGGLVLILALGVACGRMDPERRIALVPEGSWSESQRTILADAADNWNLELGTWLEVGGGPADQEVSVSISDTVCAFAAGWTAADQRSVSVCSLDPLFTTLLHELGHVLNIDAHGDDPDSVMSDPGSGPLSEEDRRLFREANPGFEGRGGCHVVRRLGEVIAPPMLVPVEHGVVALLPREEHVEYLEPGGLGEWRSRGSISTGGGRAFQAFPTPEGFGIAWAGRGSLRIATIEWASGHVVRWPALSLPGLRDPAGLRGAVALSNDVYLVIQHAGSYGVLRASPGGAVAEVLQGPGSHARLVATPDAVYLAVELADGTTRLLRVDRGELERSVILFEDSPGDLGSVALAAGSGEIVAAMWKSDADDYYTAGDSAELVRVDARTLAVLGRRRLALPAQHYASARELHVSLTANDLLVSLAVGTSAHLLQLETYIAGCDPDTLTQRKAWRRLSTPDVIGSEHPVAFGSTVLWQERSGGERLEAVSRCIGDQP